MQQILEGAEPLNSVVSHLNPCWGGLAMPRTLHGSALEMQVKNSHRGKCSTGQMNLKGSNVKRHFQMTVDNITYNSVCASSRSKTPPSFDVNRKPTSKMILSALVT